MINIKSNEYLLNEDIKGDEVRIVGGELISKSKALEIAEDNSADLIEISNNKGIAICVIEQYSKFLYNKKKSEKNKPKNIQKSGLKEIKFGLCTGENDLLHKSKKVNEFLKDGYKVKVSISLRGREIARNKDAIKMVEEFTKLCGATYDKNPKLEGSVVFAILTKQK